MGIAFLGLGNRIEHKDEKALLKEICQTLDMSFFSDFPGAQPVTMSRSDLEDLKRKDYYVCEKSDGVRSLLYLKTIKNKTYVFAIDRNCHFVQIKKKVIPQHPILFDGEIIKNKDNTFTYMIFDTIIYNGRCIAQESLHTRLNAASNYLYNTKKWLDHIGEKNDKFFSLVVKMMHKSYGLAEVYRKIIPEQTHENDGLMFTCVDHAYVPGSCRAFLKWKPPYLNSIDFRLKKSNTVKDFYYLYALIRYGNEIIFGTYWSDEIVKDLECNVKARDGKDQMEYYKEKIDYSNLDGKIGEFSYKPNEYTLEDGTFNMIQGRWSLLRIRTDKSSPNGYKTALNIVFSIQENLSYEELEKSIPEIRSHWKNRKAQNKRKAEEVPVQKRN